MKAMYQTKDTLEGPDMNRPIPSAPNANKYANEANPIYNTAIKAPDFDALR